MLSHPLANFKIQKNYQNETKFNGVYSRNNLLEINDEAHVMNLNEFKSIGTHWIAFYVNVRNIIYFDSFVVEHIPKEIKKFIGNKNILTHIYRMQAYDSIMGGYIGIGFIYIMLKGKRFLDYTNSFSPNEY